MRLIDADKLVGFITDRLNEKDPLKKFGHDAIEILTFIEYESDAIDAVNVVRCKDCVSYGINTNNGKPLSYMCDCCMPNDFCSNGERKEQDNGDL